MKSGSLFFFFGVVKCINFLDMSEKEFKYFGEEQRVKKIKFHSSVHAWDVVAPDGQIWQMGEPHV